MIRRGAHKYHARRTQIGVERFPSQLEADVFAHLSLLVAAGDLRDLRRQVRVHLCCDVRWFVDFAATDAATGLTLYVEAKGIEVEAYGLKKKLWRAFGHGPLQIYKRRGSGVACVETVRPDHAALGRDDLQLQSVPAPAARTAGGK